MQKTEEDDFVDGMPGSWGTGLLWPVLRYAAAFAVILGIAHWFLNAGNGAPVPLSQPVGAITPQDAPKTGADAVEEYTSGSRTLHADRLGHYFMDADVNGQRVEFLVDTGASVLTLSQNDAQKLGLNPQALTYSEQFQTANGVAYGAPVRLREFRLGSFSLHDVQAAVMQQSMPISLLGVNVLSRFAGHDVDGDKMTLRW
ncbi:MAG: TIGR02281 family clan AA aspartic protease [Alphaproteobacteria bacterium]